MNPANDNRYSHNWMRLTRNDKLRIAAFFVVMAMVGWWVGSIGWSDMQNAINVKVAGINLTTKGN